MKTKNFGKRCLSLLLTLVMMAGMLPVMTEQAEAAELGKWTSGNYYNEKIANNELAIDYVYSLIEKTNSNYKAKIHDIMYKASYRPKVLGGIAFHPTNDESMSSVVRDGVLGNVNIPKSAGCLAHAEYVTTYVYGSFERIRSREEKDWVNNSKREYTADEVKDYIEMHASPGEAIGFGYPAGRKFHAVAFLCENEGRNGFYALSYGEPYIDVIFCSYSRLASIITTVLWVDDADKTKLVSCPDCANLGVDSITDHYKKNGDWICHTVRRSTDSKSSEYKLWKAECRSCHTEFIPIELKASDYTGQCKVTATDKCKRTYPYDPDEPEDQKLGVKMKKGETIEVVGAVRNAYNHIWYKTKDNYYVYSGDVSEITKPVSTLSISPAKTSYTIEKGHSCNVTGTITSNYPLTKVTAKLGNNGNPNWFNKTFTNNLGTSYNIGNTAGINSFKGAELTAGTHTLQITAFDSGGGEDTRDITITVTDTAKQTCAKPTIKPEAKDCGYQTVTIASDTSGATIYWSYSGKSGNGPTPVTLKLKESAYVTAYASKSGMNNSNSYSAQINVPMCNPPYIDPKQTADGIQVSINADSGAAIRYKVDGGSLQTYSKPLLLTEDSTVTAYAEKKGCVSSWENEAEIVTSVPSVPTLSLLSTKTDIAVGNAVNLAWNKVDAVKKYYVYSYLDGEELGQAIETTGTSVSVPTTAAGVYSFTVTAENYAGMSGESNGVQVTAHDPVKVRFEDWDETLLSEQTVNYGGSAVEPTVAPTRRGYTFTGWDQSLKNFTQDTTVTAKYQINTYTVQFYDVNGTDRIDKKTVTFGDAVDETEAREKVSAFLGQGYVFAGWHISQCDEDSDQDLEHIDSDMKLVATKVWQFEDLPIVTEITAASRNESATGYDVDLKLTCADEEVLKDKYKKVKVIAALKTEEDQFLASEMTTLNLKAGDFLTETPRELSMFISYDGNYLADQVEVSVVGIDENDHTGGAVAETVSIEPEITVIWSNPWVTWEELPEEGRTHELLVSKTQYRYQDSTRYVQTLKNTTGIAPTVAGYTLVNTSSAPGEPSGWSDTKPASSANRTINTRSVTTTRTEYRYGRYVNPAGNHDCWCPTYFKSLGYSPSLEWTGWSSTRYATKKGSNGNTVFWTCGYCKDAHTYKDSLTYKTSDSKGTRWWWAEYLVNGKSYYWEESRNVSTTKTQYQYQDTIYTYTFEKWSPNGDWSEWGDEPYTEYIGTNNKRDVEEQTVYRYPLNNTSVTPIESNVNVQTVSGLLDTETDLGGKLATIMVYKQTNSDPTEPQLEYIGQTLIGGDNSYDFTIRTKENPNAGTGDFTVALALEGASNVVNVDKILADKEEFRVQFLQFYDYDDYRMLGEEQIVELGGAAEAPELPAVPGQRFICWKADINYVTHDMSVMPVYVPEEYSVVFVDYENQTVSMDTDYVYGSALTAPETPNCEGMTFKGWNIYANSTGELIGTGAVEVEGITFLDTDLNDFIVSDDLIIVADWEPVEYTVTFLAADGTTPVDVQTVVHGEAAEPPAFTNVPEGMEFLGWSTDVEWWNVTADLEVTPLLVYETTTGITSNLDSYESGSYRQLELTADEGATVYYTLDGSEPDPKNVETEGGDEITYIYDPEHPVELTEDAYIRAIAIKEEQNDSNIIEVYFSYQPDDYDDSVADLTEIGTYNILAELGKEFEIDLNLDSDAGLAAYLFTVECNRNIFYVDYDDETGFDCSKGAAAENGSMYCAPYGDTGWQILWFSTDESDVEGNLFKLKMKVSDGADGKSYPIKISYSPANTLTKAATEADAENILVSFTSDTSTLLGDANGDGLINAKDVIRIIHSQSILGDVELTETQEKAADVTGDGAITLADVTRLARYLVGLAELG